MWISIKRFQTYVLGFALLCSQGIALGQGASWKTELKESFSKAVERIRQIVGQGETPAEASEFAKRFDNQALWFDKTLAGTNNRLESSYYLLNQRKVALSNIVAMQEWAERVLKDRLAAFAQPLPDYRKVRLLLLYEVSSAMNKKSGDGVAGVANTSLTQTEIDEVVDRVLDQASRSVGVTLAPSQPVQPVVVQAPASQVPSEVMLKLDKLQAQVDQGLELSRQLQSAVQQGNDASALRLRTAIADAEKRAMQECKQYFVPRLEEAAKAALGLQAIMLDTNQRLARSNDELKHWQTVAHGERYQRQQAVEKGILTEELADRRLTELLLFLDMKRTGVNESSLGKPGSGAMLGEQAKRPDQGPSGVINPEHRDQLAVQHEAERRGQLEQELEQRAELERGLKK
jgi:hypothetical protein